MSLDELKGVLKETLEARGVLKQLQAEIRAHIFNALDDHSVKRPSLSNENLLINELIREYLEFNNYRNTLSVLIPETGQPEESPFEPTFLENHLHVLPQPPNQPRMPLLYRIVHQMNAGTHNTKASTTPGFTDAELARDNSVETDRKHVVFREDADHSISVSPRRRHSVPEESSKAQLSQSMPVFHSISTSPRPISFTHQ